MFAYSLSGLQIDQSAAGTVLEVEENEITARSAVYQTLGRIFGAPDPEHATNLVLPSDRASDDSHGVTYPVQVKSSALSRVP